MSEDVFNGLVKAVARSGKAFMMEDMDGTWFNVFRTDQLPGNFGRGADVEFRYTVKTKGGKTYYDVKNAVKVLNPGAGASAAGATGAAAAEGTVRFGKAALDTQRSIVRQNACNVMATVLASNLNVDPALVDAEQAAHLASIVVAGAQVIEEFTSGDLDVKLAQEKAEASAGEAESAGTDEE